MKKISSWRILLFVLALSVFAFQSSFAKTRPAFVTVAATAPLATEPGDNPGLFTISRRGDTNAVVTIQYSLSGTATNGVDYQTISDSVTLSAGQTSTNIIITPVDESPAPAFKTVVLTLVHEPVSVSGYVVGPDRRAVLYIEYNYTNVAPTVEIVSPTNGATFLSMPNIALTALAGDSNGWVTSVEFFANGTSVAVATNEATPEIERSHSHHFEHLSILRNMRRRFTALWSNVPPGAYTLTAVATDNAGEQTTSSNVDITVSTNLPTPEIKLLTPRNGEQFFDGVPINMFAAAGEQDGVVDTVEFFGNGSSLGVVTNEAVLQPTNPQGPGEGEGDIHDGHGHGPEVRFQPFFLQWTNAPTGSNTIYAVATDANGSQATSDTVTVNVLTNTVGHHHGHSGH